MAEERTTKGTIENIMIVGLLVMCVSAPVNCIYGVWGYFNVAYDFDRDLGMEIDLLYEAPDLVTMQRQMDVILSHDLFNHPDTPLSLLSAVRPTKHNTLWKCILVLEGLSNRIDKAVLFQERLLGNQSNLPYVEINRFPNELESLHDKMRWDVSKRDIESAWTYQYANWFFWYGPGTMLLVNVITSLSLVVTLMGYIMRYG